MKNPPFDPHAELMLWGPAPRYPLLRMAKPAYGLFVDFAKEFPGYSWPPGLILNVGTRFVWMHELAQLEANGGKLFLEKMLPHDSREETRENWKAACASLTEIESHISPKQLGELSDEALVALWNRFQDAISWFWTQSSLPELSNYGSIPLLRTKLKSFVPEEKLDTVLEILTAPEAPSFYQEEEFDLVETNDLSTHQRAYFWLKNSYAHVEVLPVEFFKERKKDISASVKEEFTLYLEDVRKKKAEVTAEYALSNVVQAYAEAITDGIVWQDTRKKEIWIYLHYEDVFVAEIARRTGYEKELLLLGTNSEVADSMRGLLDLEVLCARKDACGLYGDKETIEVLDPEIVRSYWKSYVDTAVAEDITEFKGTIASKGTGRVEGKVRIVLDAHNPPPFEEGEILVTTMTTPEFIFVMKKASAIITDTGGLTSHAAIVSRELKKPCIIGTKIATKVLKDGDVVEVDADTGVVRILK